MEIPEIEELKNLVEEKYGRKMSSTKDYEGLAYTLAGLMPDTVSTSTLKRIWGYVNDKHKPRKYSLDILSQYIGHKDYDAFVKYLKTSTKYNSSFFNAMQIHSSELNVGQYLQIGWSPNRLLKIEYLGDSMYEIKEASNSKLLAGDRFMTGCFIKEQPLYLPFIERNGERTSPFVAGRNGGLSVITKTEE